MTTEAFIYWLQGYFEISDAKTLNEKQVSIIKDHLALVLKKETPDRSEEESESVEVSKKVLRNLPRHNNILGGGKGNGLLC